MKHGKSALHRAGQMRIHEVHVDMLFPQLRPGQGQEHHQQEKKLFDFDGAGYGVVRYRA